MMKVIKQVWTKVCSIRRIVTRHELANGYKIPNWYGIAYIDWMSERSVIYVVPLNLIVRFSRALYYLTLKLLKVPRWFEWEEKIYRSGYRRGQKDMTESNIQEMIRDMSKRMKDRIKFIEFGPEGVEEKSYEEVMGDDEEKKDGIDWGRILNGEDKKH